MIKIATEYDAKYLRADCGVRYWEDARVNGVTDQDGELIPCRNVDTWSPLIEIDTGVIVGWPKGTTADLHYKVCDDGKYVLFDASMQKIVGIDGYVPTIMSPGENGYGDYVIMTIDGDGRIADWKVDLSDFEGASKDR